MIHKKKTIKNGLLYCWISSQKQIISCEFILVNPEDSRKKLVYTYTASARQSRVLIDAFLVDQSIQGVKEIWNSWFSILSIGRRQNLSIGKIRVHKSFIPFFFNSCFLFLNVAFANDFFEVVIDLNTSLISLKLLHLVLLYK